MLEEIDLASLHVSGDADKVYSKLERKDGSARTASPDLFLPSQQPKQKQWAQLSLTDNGTPDSRKSKHVLGRKGEDKDEPIVIAEGEAGTSLVAKASRGVVNRTYGKSCAQSKSLFTDSQVDMKVWGDLSSQRHVYLDLANQVESRRRLLFQLSVETKRHLKPIS